MDLYNTYLTIQDCCKYTDGLNDNFTGWCRKGYIKATRNAPRSSWRILAIDFANFLYYNNYYLDAFRKKQLSGQEKELQNEILREVASRPPVMDAHEVAILFNVHHQTIYNWLKKGIFIPCGNASNRLPVIEISEIRNGFEREPRLKLKFRNIYTALNRRKVNRKLLFATLL